VHQQDNHIVESSQVSHVSSSLFIIICTSWPDSRITHSHTHTHTLTLISITHKHTHSFVRVVVTGHNDDPNGSHIQITCISDEFKGKTIVQRQRLIYKAIWDEMSGPTAPVHAVDSIIAKTPEEANM